MATSMFVLAIIILLLGAIGFIVFLHASFTDPGPGLAILGLLIPTVILLLVGGILLLMGMVEKRRSRY